MGKWQLKHTGTQRYNKEWEDDPELQEWIQEVPGEETKAYCKVCKKEVKPNLKDLKSHGKTKTHRKKANPNAVFTKEEPKEIRPLTSKAAALKIATHIACHSSVLTVDHLGALIKDITQKRFSMHRTKCTMLIRKVLGPEMHKEFLDDISNAQYSLIVDETLDPSYENQLRIVIRYYSMKLKRIVTSFLGLLPLDGGQPDFAVLNFLKQNCLDIGNCCGLATDCSDEPSQKNSIVTKILEYNPNIVHIKCMCHSLQICMSKAFQLLPRNLDFMISETYNWFLRSPSRQQKYKHVFECLNFGDQAMKVMKYSDSTWLLAAPCLNKVLDHYDELKLYFQLAQSQENNYTAEILFHMYDDPVNKLYFSFLQPIVNEFSRVYKQTESESGGTHRLAKEFLSLYKRLLQLIVKPDVITSQKGILEIDISDADMQLPLAAVDFGAKFGMVLSEAVMMHPTQVDNAKQNCWEFVFAVASQLRQILPHNIQILDSMSTLAPSVVLGPNKPRLSSLPFLSLFNGDLIQLNAQWRRLETVSWQKTSDTSMESFWGEVASHTNHSGDHDFQDLGTFMIALLTLPLTNASVDKIFNQMNLIKSKPRNRMGQQLMENILRVRSYMRRNKICCDEFMPTEQMIHAFRADIYKTETSDELEVEVITDTDMHVFPQPEVM